MTADGLVWRISGVAPRRIVPAGGTAAITLRTLLSFLTHGKFPVDGGRYTGAARDSGGSDALSDSPEPDDLVVELTQRFWERLRLFAARRLRDSSMAEDVAQEVLRRTLEALRGGRVENAEALPAFLFQTARHVCMQRARSAGREARAYQRLGANDEEAPLEDDPLAGLISAERREAVRDALARLEEGDRDLLRLSYAEGLDAPTIGERLGISAGAVRVRRHRAIERLTAILGVTKSTKRELS